MGLSRSQYYRAMADVHVLADRIAIDDLLTHYSTLLDTRRFDELDQVFTHDAVLDYRSAGVFAVRFPKFATGWPASFPPSPGPNTWWSIAPSTSRRMAMKPPLDHSSTIRTAWTSTANRGCSLSAVRTMTGW